MTTPLTEIIISAVVIGSAVLSTIFIIGIVWRVEKELDIAYKLFAVAIISFTLSEVLSFFQFEGKVLISFSVLIAKLFFAVCFLAGIVIMRDILRRMEGEKKNPNLFTEEHKRPI